MVESLSNSILNMLLIELVMGFIKKLIDKVKNLAAKGIAPNITVYQDSIDLPDEYTEILAELKTRASEVRLTHIQKGNPNRRKETGNVAVARLVLSTGEVIQKEATSKKRPMNRPTNEKKPKGYTGPKQHFAPYPNPKQINSTTGEPALNIEHAEYKVFNALADALLDQEVDENTTGQLVLYTEKEMCPACENVSLDAALFFKNILNHIAITIIWTIEY